MKQPTNQKLWLLRPVESLETDNNPWFPWFDKAFGFVVRAKNEAEARRFAQENAGDEAYNAVTKWPWIDERYSTCTELLPDGDAGVVITDFASA